jgi:predicted RNA-binding protein with PUA-like domain
MPWLVKTEPGTYSIRDLARDRRTRWDGVRNYQARNTMRDLMKVGDEVLVYHSNAEPPGVAGVARVSAAAIPDATALDPSSPYHDPKATSANPIWASIEIAFVREFPRLVTLEELRAQEKLEGMALLQRGQRLSVLPVRDVEFKLVLELAERSPPHATRSASSAAQTSKAKTSKAKKKTARGKATS